MPRMCEVPMLQCYWRDVLHHYIVNACCDWCSEHYVIRNIMSCMMYYVIVNSVVISMSLRCSSCTVVCFVCIFLALHVATSFIHCSWCHWLHQSKRSYTFHRSIKWCTLEPLELHFIEYVWYCCVTWLQCIVSRSIILGTVTTDTMASSLVLKDIGWRCRRCCRLACVWLVICMYHDDNISKQSVWVLPMFLISFVLNIMWHYSIASSATTLSKTNTKSTLSLETYV